MFRDAARSSPRAGAVLIIVVGLAMILLGIAMSFMMRMRSDSQETRVVLAEAQGRLMLHAALMYLQESSRLGWGDESFGWTDVRDGSLGPRPPRDAGSAGTKAIPPPTWWKIGAYQPSPDDSVLPAQNLRTWPYPGSCLRSPMAVPVQPPYATQLRYAYNPVNTPPGFPAYGEPGYETPWMNATLGVDDLQRKVDGSTLPTSRNWPIAWADAIFDPARGSTGALDPQPQADNWYDPGYTGAPGQKPDFIQGARSTSGGGDWVHRFRDPSNPNQYISVQLAVKPGTENLCWFRIYREVQADHDGNGKPDYDRVVMYDAKNPSLKNWSVFVIACGVGPTRGYRFWNAAEAASWEGLNSWGAGAVTLGQEWAEDSGLFFNQADFLAARAATKVSWYRVEWTALQGGGFIPEKYSWAGARFYPRKKFNGTTDFMVPRPYPGFDIRRNIIPDENSSDMIFDSIDGGYADGLRYSAPKTYGGNFRWVQRLDHEPPNW